MQFKKEFIRKAILENAKIEFLERGFRDAAIRSIAKRADTAPSNIYNYFKNKDEIFCGVLEEFMFKFKTAQKAFIEHVDDEDHDPNDDHHNQMILTMLNAIKQYRTELILLIDKAKGSSHEAFLQDVTNWYAGVMKRDLESSIARMKLPKIEFQEDTIYLLSGMVISLLVSTLYNKVDDDSILTVASEISQFFSSGWQGLIGWKVKQQS